MRRRAVIALLLDRFHLSLEQYARLTDRQIVELYLHARKSDGTIDDALPLLTTQEDKQKEESEPAATFASESAQLDILASVLQLPADKVAGLRAQLKAKHKING